MKQFFVLLALTGLLNANAQQPTYFSAAITTSQNAMPFGKFAGLFGEIFHPGLEFSYGKILLSKARHEWFREFRLGWLYHRFVQHGIPLSFHYGYRYKFGNRFSAQSAFGAGYMHSIPAAEKFKLDDNGSYHNNKGTGRMQATASFELGLGFILHRKAERPIRIVAGYQQRLQFPFVRSYVPLLPYNSFLLGIAMPVKKQGHPSTSLR